MICENHTGGNCADKTFQKIRAESGDVADVITDIVCDGSRVTRIVFRDVCLGLAYQVSAHISSLGIDTAADTVEHRNHRTAECIAGQRHGKRQVGDSQRVGMRFQHGELTHSDAEDDKN